MFEWGHAQQITCFRSGGNSRVTRMRFNYQGNKVTDKMLLYSLSSPLPQNTCKLAEASHVSNLKYFFKILSVFSAIHTYVFAISVYFQFGIVDADGYISLYQTNWKCCPLTGTSPKPYLVS